MGSRAALAKRAAMQAGSEEFATVRGMWKVSTALGVVAGEAVADKLLLALLLLLVPVCAWLWCCPTVLPAAMKILSRCLADLPNTMAVTCTKTQDVKSDRP